MLDTEQAGLALSVSPDDGNGARMSYLRFVDQPDGVDVFFDDVVNPSFGAEFDFRETSVATLDRTSAHTIRFSIDFVAGPANDVAKIYVDGALKTTGTTWEDYYRNDKEAAGNDNQILPIDRLLFRAGGIAVPATAGKGFLIDNLTLASGSSTAPAATVVTTSEHATSCTEYSVREVTTTTPFVQNEAGAWVAGVPVVTTGAWVNSTPTAEQLTAAGLDCVVPVPTPTTPVSVLGTSATANPLPASAAAGQANTSGQLVAGGLAGLVALLVMGAGLALRRRHGAV